MAFGKKHFNESRLQFYLIGKFDSFPNNHKITFQSGKQLINLIKIRLFKNHFVELRFQIFHF